MPSGVSGMMEIRAAGKIRTLNYILFIRNTFYTWRKIVKNFFNIMFQSFIKMVVEFVTINKCLIIKVIFFLYEKTGEKKVSNAFIDNFQVLLT